MEDHLHLLLSLSNVGIGEAMQKLKANSSRWIRETFLNLDFFEWQRGYGAFSIGISQVDSTLRYIRNQEEHHRRADFMAELKAFYSSTDWHGLRTNFSRWRLFAVVAARLRKWAGLRFAFPVPVPHTYVWGYWLSSLRDWVVAAVRLGNGT